MAMVSVLLYLPVLADLRFELIGLVQRSARLHSQWLCHDDKTVNSVVAITVSIAIQCSHVV